MRDTPQRRRTAMRWLVGGAALMAILSSMGVAFVGLASGKDEAVLQRITQEVVPPAGAMTAYGIPLSLASLPQFLDWRDKIELTVPESQAFHDALTGLAAPCCDDNTAFRCCCEKSGQRCNLVTSGKGLAAYLLHEKGFTAEETREAVLQWFRFARPDYYLAKALEGEGLDPGTYGLTTRGNCYRGMCEVPISEGGCGGMGNLIEPALQGAKG